MPGTHHATCVLSLLYWRNYAFPFSRMMLNIQYRNKPYLKHAGLFYIGENVLLDFTVAVIAQ